MKLKYLSLFSGCGMFEAAIKEVFPDAECTGFNEKSIASVKRIIDKEKDYARILDNFQTKTKTMTSRYNASNNADFLSIKKIGYIKSDSQGNRIYNADYKAVNQSANGGGLGAKTGLYEIEKEVIRRLTPIEVERLFTLFDGYTERGKGDVKISDSQRYKMLGNGVIKDVVVHILEHLKNYIVNKEYILDGLELII